MPEEKRAIRSALKPFIIILTVLFLDRLTKLAVLYRISPGESIPIIKNVFHFTLVANTGGAFGMGSSMPALFFIVGIVALFILFLIFFKFKESMAAIERYGLLFIISGTIGNLTDRVLHGHVIDFLDFRVWPVFNVADSFISAGAALIVISSVVRSVKEKRRKKNA